MPYIVSAVIVIAVVAIAGYLRRHGDGTAILQGLISGEFDSTPIGRQLQGWFAEEAAREQQRRDFVGFALASGVAHTLVAERLMTCIAAEWRGTGARFGDELAKKVEQMIEFDPPGSPEQALKQEAAKRQLAEFAAKLRMLNSRG